jgi:membrane protein DedA with SNARE-associated domain
MIGFWLLRHMMGIGDTITKLVETGHPWLQHHGLLAVGIALFAETLFITGFFVPGFAILVATGFLIAEGVFRPVPVLIVAWSAAMLGDQISYVFGYYLGRRIFHRKLRFFDRLCTALEDEGIWLLLSYHYSSTLRTAVPSAAGCSRYNMRKWLMYDSLGVLIWIVVMLWIGFIAHGVFRSEGNSTAQALKLLPTVILLVVALRIRKRLKQCSPCETKVR